MLVDRVPAVLAPVGSASGTGWPSRAAAWPRRWRGAGRPGRRAGAGRASVTLAAVAVLAALPAVADRARRRRCAVGDRVRSAGAGCRSPTDGASRCGFALVALAVAGRWPVGRVGLPVLAALPFVAAALPVLLVAAGAPWPVLPAAVLLAGLAALLVAALAAPARRSSPVAAPVGVVLVASGLAGLLATRAGTLAGRGRAAGGGGGGRRRRPRPPRYGSPAAWRRWARRPRFAVTAPLAGGLPLRAAAYPCWRWPRWCWPPRR